MGSTAFRRASTTLAALLSLALAGAAAAQEPVPQVRMQAPGYYRMMLGDYEITTVSDGTVPLDFAKLMTNTTPEEVRALFAVGEGLTEDPVTGSLNASLAQWLIGTGRLPTAYVAAQGTVLGRRGRVHVEAEGGQVWVGGQVIPGITGTVAL
jgi:hypothetical protein